MIKKTCALLVFVYTLWGCSLVSGFLNMKAVQIVAWSPDREWVAAGQLSRVTVTFSASMNRALAEEAFSLSRDNDRLQGHFYWEAEDTTLIFAPEIPFADGHRYTVNVLDSAEDVYGNSLLDDFAFRFATVEELVPPMVLSHEPADGSQLQSIREPIRVVFSEPVDAASFYLGFSLFPSVHGSFEWSPDAREVMFVPLADYRSGESYEVVLGREIADRSGNRLAEEFRFDFHAGDIPDPSIETVETLVGGKPLTALQLGGGIDPSLQIEKDEQFLLLFSQGLREEQKTDLLKVDPITPFSLSWDGESRSCVLVFGEALCWNQVYRLDLLGLTYSFVVNGPQSLPMKITALTYCPDLDAPAGEGKYVLLDFADNVDFSGALNPAFDFYLDHAAGVQVDLGSFLQAFELSVVPACISVSLIDVELSPLAIEPSSPPAEGQSIVRLHCSIEEYPAETGTVTFRVGTELRDTAFNHLSEEFVLLINNN